MLQLPATLLLENLHFANEGQYRIFVFYSVQFYCLLFWISLSISVSLIYWDFHTQTFLGLIENSQKKRKYAVIESADRDAPVT